jgi:hypothetical protein
MSKKIEEILASEEALIPSSGFSSAVMERIGEESAALQPIPFPWKRAVPGMALAGVVFGWGGVELVRHGLMQHGIRSDSGAISLQELSSALQAHIGAGATRPLESLGWVALALGMSWLSWLLARGMAGRSGLI